jgi:hypothetical protein
MKNLKIEELFVIPGNDITRRFIMVVNQTEIDLSEESYNKLVKLRNKRG